ncbi:MAG: hypothetical protein DA330_09545 [Nitrososphaera sp.]|nr:hypothetical protein [Nitrososphaera sp.]
MYEVSIQYPNGERKLKLRCKMIETAIAYEDSLDKFFARLGITKTPSGVEVKASDCNAIIDEV